MFPRHLHWFSQSPEGKLWFPDEWPDYETPSGVGEETPPEETPPARQPEGQPSAGQPPARAQAQPQGGQPQGGQPGGQPAGQPQNQPPGRGGLPQYRQDQIAQREEQERFNTAVNSAVQTGLRKILGDALGLTNQPPGDPRRDRIRSQLLEVFPELKELIDQKAGILASAGAAPQLAETTKVFWQGVASRTLGTLFDSVATTLLGAGKAAKDLDQESQDEVRDMFISWVERDKTGERVGRYEAQDPQLITEYLRVFTSRYLDPVRRTAAVNVSTVGRARQQQPVPGAAGMPPAAQPPQVDNQDEDAVHGRGWAVVQQLRQQSA